MTDAPEEKVIEIKPRFNLIPFDQVTVGTERLYLVKGLIPRTGTENFGGTIVTAGGLVWP
jgi:hypothetical protein